jgi:DNA repair exonuclease SbcCD ATPase subunit
VELRYGAYIARVNAHLGRYCRELKLPFLLSVDPSEQEMMVRIDDLVVPAMHRLSEGQRSMMAWAWTLALHAVHAGRIGFLVLDEPTVGLDAENRRCVAEVIRGIAGYCRSSGTQLIMVTHDEDLSSVFDTVITLAPGEVTKHVL